MYNELYTGYFAKCKKYRENGYIPVSVAGKTPSNCVDEKWLDFAPRKELFQQWKNGIISDVKYGNEYMTYLSTIPIEDIEELRELTRSGKFIMCCYEKTGDFCHRHYLAHFLRTKCLFNVYEVDL